MIIKGNELINIINSKKNSSLELGCGNNKKNKNYLGVDILENSSADIVGEIFEVLKNINDNSVNSISSYHFFEHIDEQKKLFDECYRVLKKNSEMTIVVPHFSNPHFYSDPTHRSNFGIFTFSYYSNENLYFRKVPTYWKKKFNIKKIDIIFKSYRPKYIAHAFKKILQLFFNSSYFMQEIYEENFCYLFPCYEIQFILKK